MCIYQIFSNIPKNWGSRHVMIVSLSCKSFSSDKACAQCLEEFMAVPGEMKTWRCILCCKTSSFIYVYRCIYIHMHACMHACMHCVDVCMYACMDVSIYLSIHPSIHPDIYQYTPSNSWHGMPKIVYMSVFSSSL